LKPTAESGSERLTASFPGHLSYYDPHVRRLKTAADLQEAMLSSDRTGKPLTVTAYHPWGVVFRSPDLWRLFYESGLFVDFAIHRGMENTSDRVVGRYQPGAIVGFCVEDFLRGKHGSRIPCARRRPIRRGLRNRKIPRSTRRRKRAPDRAKVLVLFIDASPTSHWADNTSFRSFSARCRFSVP
jgi:hypothetical protein